MEVIFYLLMSLIAVGGLVGIITAFLFVLERSRFKKGR